MSYPNAFEKLARLQEAELPEHQPPLEQTKEDMLRQLDEKQTNSRSRTKWIMLAAGILMVAGITAVFVFSAISRPATMTQSHSDRWLIASATQSETMDFTDGSKIVLSPNASARVSQTAPHSVRVLVNNGEARVRVTHFEQTSWRLEAGPYTVRVTGTVFTISWDASAAHFLLNLQQGSVVVTGPMLEDGKRIRAGEQIAVAVREQRMEISSARDSARVPLRESGPSDAVTSIAPDRVRTDRTATLSPAKRRNSAHSLPSAAVTTDLAESKTNSWTAMCRQGAFSDVVSEARERGLKRVIRNGALKDLMALGEALRLTRNAAIANDVYRSVRARYTRTPQAAASAFYLGKIAFDQQHAYGIATTWLEAYLKERPRGAFSRDALGKLIEAQVKIGKSDAARRNAGLYLNRHPGGPHAEIARQVVGKR